MLAAVEAWKKRDHEAEWKTWLSWLDNISKQLRSIDGIETAVREPTGLSNRSPSLLVSWDPARLHITAEEVRGRTFAHVHRLQIHTWSRRRRSSINGLG